MLAQVRLANKHINRFLILNKKEIVSKFWVDSCWCIQHGSLYHFLVKCEKFRDINLEFFWNLNGCKHEIGFWMRLFDSQSILENKKTLKMIQRMLSV